MSYLDVQLLYEVLFSFPHRGSKGQGPSAAAKGGQRADDAYWEAELAEAIRAEQLAEQQQGQAAEQELDIDEGGWLPK